MNIVGKSFAWVRLFPTNKTETLVAAAIVLSASQSESAKAILRNRNTSEIVADAVPRFVGEAVGFHGTTASSPTVSTHSGVALPFDPSHLTGRNIDIERSVAPNSFSLIFLRDSVMTWSERNFESTLRVSRELCRGTAFVTDNKRCIGQRLRADHARSDRARMSRGKRNHAFNSCFGCFGHGRG